MKLSDNWFTVLGDSEDGKLIFVTGRLDLEAFRMSKKLKVRVDIKWAYDADEEGMPAEADAELIAEIEPLLRKEMERDKLAILVGNYTGAGEKSWIWYTRHLPTFGERLNNVLSTYQTLPLDIDCVEDEDWDEYQDLLTFRSYEDD